jgi:hypothetical protein
MKRVVLFVFRITCSISAAVLGLNIGFFVWFFLVMIFGYPGDTPSGTRIPSASRVLRMNEWQGFLEYGCSELIPLVFAGLLGYFTFRLKLWNSTKPRVRSDPSGTIYHE